MADLITGIASAGSGLIGSIVGAISAKKQQERQFAQQKELLDLQNQFSLDQWNREMDYENPVNEMARMQAAGINLNVAAQGIAGNPANTSAPQSSSAPSVTDAITPYSSNMAQAVQNPLDIGIKLAQKKNIEADTENKENTNPVLQEQANHYKEMVKTLQSEQVLNDLEAKKLLPYAEHAQEVFDLDIDTVKKNLQKIDKDMQKIDGEIEELGSRHKKNLQEIEESKASVGLIEAQKATEIEMSNYYKSLENLQNQKYALIRDYGTDDTSIEGAIYRDYVDGDKRNADVGLEAVEKIQNAESRGVYNADPSQEEFRTLADYRKSLQGELNDCQDVRNQLYEEFKNNKIKFFEYQQGLEKVNELHNQIMQDLENADKDFRKQSYKNGHATLWQNLSTSLTGVGAGVAAGIITKRVPAASGRSTVRGFGR